MWVDTDDLLDSNEVAQALGLAGRQVVASYCRQYAEFPEPVVNKGRNLRLWHRRDVVAWRDRRSPAALRRAAEEEHRRITEEIARRLISAGIRSDALDAALATVDVQRGDPVTLTLAVIDAVDRAPAEWFDRPGDPPLL